MTADPDPGAVGGPDAGLPCIEPITVTIPLTEYRRLHALDLADRERRRNRERKAAHPRQDGVAAVRRMIQALGRQTVPVPGDLEPLLDAVRDAQADVVDRLMRDEHWSWRMVGRDLGISHQSARERFTRRSVKTARRRGGQPAELR
jgi:hypothetical protein